MDKKKRILYWRLSCATAFVLVILTFTPLVTPPGIYHPQIFGIPYTLWTGFLITVGLVVLTYIASRVHPARDGEGEI